MSRKAARARSRTTGRRRSSPGSGRSRTSRGGGYPLPPMIAPPICCSRIAARIVRRLSHLVRGSWLDGSAHEERGDLRRALAVQFDDVAGAKPFEQLLDILIAQPDAAVRFGEADRPRLVGAVDAESLHTEPDPSRPDRIAGARPDHS